MRQAAVVAGAGALAVAGAGVVNGVVHRRAAARGYELPSAPAVDEPEFGRLAEALTGAPVTDGNTFSVLRNGCRIFPAMLEAIRSAQRTVDFATYVYWTGDIAEEFVVALSERARAGVEVNVLLDAVGAARMDRRLVARMRGAGASVVWFRPPHWSTLHKMDHRTHRKILVVDGRVGFTGGVGIAEEWTGDCQDADHWRDTHVRVEGPAVRGLLAGFQENWSEATRTILAGDHLPALQPQPGGQRAQVTRSSASLGTTDAEELVYLAIRAARQRLWLASAYVAPRAAFVAALVDAVGRGVDVRLLANGSRTDKETVRQAGRRSYARLLAGGVRVFEYQRTMLHAKIFTVDGRWASVGSINLDNRSFRLNDELTLSVYGSQVAGVLDEHFEADLADSREITADGWARRPVTARLTELAAGAVRQEL